MMLRIRSQVLHQLADGGLLLDSGGQREIVDVARERTYLVRRLFAEIGLQLPHGHTVVHMPAELAVVEPPERALAEMRITVDFHHVERQSFAWVQLFIQKLNQSRPRNLHVAVHGIRVGQRDVTAARLEAQLEASAELRIDLHTTEHPAPASARSAWSAR